MKVMTNEPIFAIMLFSKPGNKDVIFPGETHSGIPDLGSTSYPGFYHNEADAIRAMHENMGDIRECSYDYGFVLKHEPGMYGNCASKDDRTYFVWDDERDGFYEAEEPTLLEKFGY